MSGAQPRGRWASRGPLQAAAGGRSGFNVSYAPEYENGSEALEVEGAFMKDLNPNRRASKQCLMRDGEGDYSLA